jgi:uncharacterized membrane protein YdbT with pleckstrin-like domain
MVQHSSFPISDNRDLPPLLRAAVAFITTEFAVTNQRVITKTGLFRREAVELMLRQIESMKIDQRLLGRLFGYGNLEIIGTGGTKSKLVGVNNPVLFRKNVNKVIEYYNKIPKPSQQ